MTIDTSLIASASALPAGTVGVGTQVAQKVAVSADTESNTSAQAQAVEQHVDKAVDKAIEPKDVVRLNNYVQTIRRGLEFRVDEGTNRTVVTVVDKDTLEVIRQIPSETAMKLSRTMSILQEHSGFLFEDKA